MEFYQFLSRVQSKTFGLFLVFTFLFFSQTYAGDLRMKLKFHIEYTEEGRELPIEAEVENIESYQVLGASFNLQIRDKLTLGLAYEWNRELGTVEPKSTQTFKAPDPWVPSMAGSYIMKFKLSSLNDINPVNDTTSYTIDVKPSLGLSFTFNQLSFLNPFELENSNTGRVDFTLPPIEKTMYANFMISVPNSSSSPKWLVQNLPLPVFPDTQKISYWIDLGKIGLTSGLEIPYLNYDYKYSDTPIDQPFESENLFFSGVDRGTYNAGGNNAVEAGFGTFTNLPEINWANEFKIKKYIYRGCTVPNIDLDSSKYNPREMIGEAGDWNCCGPASAINSLQWLEDTNEKIPKSGLSIRDKLKLFNKLSNRPNEEGLNTGGIIKGKLAFIDSLRLPIHVKWQGVPYDTAIVSPNARFGHIAQSKNDSVGAKCDFDWLAAEIEHGEDVEVKFGWYDTLDVRHGGHWVVVSGVSDVTTAKGLYIKDDESQEKEGGTRQTYVNWVTDANGRPRLSGLSGDNKHCWVESVVSESYDSTITFISVSSKVLRSSNELKLKVYENPASKYKPVNINFYISEPGEVKLYIYEISGRLVYSRKINYSSQGDKNELWNGKRSNGQAAAAGAYIVKVVSGNQESTTKIVRQE
jgi:hypothetical protein